MKIGVFVPDNNEEHLDVLLAFTKGIIACGHDPIVYAVTDYQPVDLAVVFGVGKKDVPISWPREHVIQSQHLRKKHVIILEKGFIKRDKYYMVGFDGLNNKADFANGGSPPDRWNNLGVKIKPWTTNGKNILVCGQVPSDASVQNVDIIQWCAYAISQIKKITERTIVFRPHPLAINRTPAIIGASYSTNTFEDDLRNSMAVVTYNSNAATDAILGGVPAFTFDAGSMTWDITSHNINDINNPHYPLKEDLQQWANNIAYTQWNKEEMECGLPWLHLTGLKASNTERMIG